MATRVIYNHDAAIDEYVAAVILANMADVSLEAIVITNGDCIAGPAMDAAWMIASYTNRTDIPLSLSAARMYNPFPYEYRADCIRELSIPALEQYAPHPPPPYPSGEAEMRRLLRHAIDTHRPVTLVCDASLTTVYDLFHAEPELEAGVDHLLWMGGAINVPGNLDPKTIPAVIANRTAEWNVFSDPFAADWVLNHPERPYRVTLMPLDVTNKATFTADFETRLQEQAKTSRLSALAAQSYALVDKEPFYEMWDVCSVCYLARPEIYKAPFHTALEVVRYGFDQGTIKPAAHGKPVDVILDFANQAAFYDYVLEVLRSDHTPP